MTQGRIVIASYPWFRLQLKQQPEQSGFVARRRTFVIVLNVKEKLLHSLDGLVNQLADILLHYATWIFMHDEFRNSTKYVE